MLSCSVWLLLAHLAGSTSSCKVSLEILHLQDASGSFKDTISSISAGINSLGEEIKVEYGDLKYGLSSFTDKPSAFRGIGSGRGWPDELDYCYRQMQPLWDGPMDDAYKKLLKNLGAGGDYPEGTWEAVYYAAMDPTAFSPPTDSLGRSGLPIIRILLIVTDDVSHYEGDGMEGVRHWNADPDVPGIHFGDTAFIKEVGGIANFNGTPEMYLEVIAGVSAAREKAIMKIIGPRTQVMTKHPGTFESYKKCGGHEYPSLEMVGNALNNQIILPVVILVPPTYVSTASRNKCSERGYADPIMTQPSKFVNLCLAPMYTEDLVGMGVSNFIVTSMENGGILADIKRSIQQLITDIDCSPPTRPPPTTTQTGTNPQDASTGDHIINTSYTGTGLDPADPQTNAPEFTIDGTGSTIHVAGSTEDGDDNGSGDGDRTTDQESLGGLIPDNGSAISGGVIAGATVGLLGLIVLGATAYRTSMFGLFQRSKGGGEESNDLVQNPQSEHDREVLEEVAIDMFQ